MASALVKASRRISEFMAGPRTVEPRKGATPIANPQLLDRRTDGDNKRTTRTMAMPARQYRMLAEADDIIVAIRRTLRFAIGELPYKIVPDIDAVKADLKAWQTIVELNLAMPGMDLHFEPQALSQEFFTGAAGALRDVLRDEFEAAQDSDDDDADALENNAHLRAFFENCVAVHNVKAEQHAARVRELFESPEPSNPNSSWRAFTDRIIDDLTLYDASAYVKNPQVSGRGIGEMYTLPGEEIRRYRMRDESTPIPPGIAYDRHRNDQLLAIYNSLELGYLAANPQADGYGKSPIESLLNLMMASLYGDAFTLDFFANNNAPRGVFDLGPNVDQPERDAVEERWNNLARAGLRRIMFVSNVEGVKGFIPMPQESNKDSEIKDLQLAWANRKAAVFGLGLGDIGFNQDLHRTTAETSHDNAQSRGVNSLAKVIEQSMNLNVVRGMMWIRDNPDDPSDTRGTAVPIFPFRDVKFAYSYADPAGDDDDADPQVKLLGSGILSINEVRKERGQPPVPGGDVHTLTSGGSLIKVADLKALPPPQAPPDPSADPAAGGPPGAPPAGPQPSAGGQPKGPPSLPPGGAHGPPALPTGAPQGLEALAKRLHALVVKG